IRFVDAYVPVAVLLSMIMAGLQAMPPVITGYRERGILRRMSVTPVRPSALLGAQMGLHGAAALLSAVLSLTVGRIVFDVALPRQLFGYALALLLAVLSALALGALVSALSRTSKVASAIGSAVFFPMMFSAGVWLPVQAMPDTLGRIVELLPFGAAAQALNEAAAGGWPGWDHLGVLALWAVLLSAAATRWFRWE
ncbi:ABC transporter permease, partial [Streptomyces hundungensis]|uniref:ABC transporter permease n=1 Tax=Streptomyces hundungensis TaxID=1077946 RepID=UPI00340DE32E